MSAAMAAGCASTEGARPPQGTGPAGTDFGYWNRDAEGAVDASFRQFITSRYDEADLSRAQADLTTDGFTCRDGNRPDGRPVPALECTRLFELNDDVHAWTVEFWPRDNEPRARYTRTRIRIPITADNDQKKQPRGR